MEVSSSLVSWLQHTTLHVSVLVLLILGVQAIFGRWLTPRWRYGIWFIVLIRLMMPQVPADPLGIRIQGSETIPAADPLPVNPEENTESSNWIGMMPSRPPSDWVAPKKFEELDLVRSIEDETEPAASKPERRRMSRTPIGLSSFPRQTHEAPVVAEAGTGFAWTDLIAGAWLLIAFGFAVRAWLQESRFRRGLRLATEVQNRKALEILESCRATLGLRRPVRLVETGMVDSPAVCGVWKPRLLLPPHLMTELDENELQHIFLHELAHLRHGDVLLNWVLTGLNCLHWFNPFVRLAISRLRSSQEWVRDHDALAAAPVVAPHHYAQTVLKLLSACRADRRPLPLVGLIPRNQDAKKRILMIVNERTNSRKAFLLGAALLCPLGWVGLTAAAPNSAAPSTTQASSPNGYERILVIRENKTPAWKTDLQRRLRETRVDIDFESGHLDDLLFSLRKSTQLNFVVHPEVWGEYFGDISPVRVQSMQLDHLLRMICNQLELDYQLTKNAVYIGYRDYMTNATELRFYKVAPLLDAARQSTWDAEDSLMDLVMEMTGWHGEWDFDSVNMRYWNGLLCINQTPEVHHRIEQILNNLLNRNKVAYDAIPDWQTELTEELQKKINVNFSNAQTGEVVRHLARETGLPIRIHPDDAESDDIHLVMDNVSVRETLDWVSLVTGLRMIFQDGAVWMKYALDTEVRYYDMKSFVESLPYPDMDEEFEDEIERQEEIMEWRHDQMEQMEDLIRETTGGNSWDDYEGAYIYDWDRMFIIAQTADTHRQIQRVLDAIRQALAN